MSPNSLVSSRTKFKAGFFLCSLLVVFTMLLAACGNGSTANTNQKHVLHIGAFVGSAYPTPQITNPYNGNAASDAPGVQGMVYETLFFDDFSTNQVTPLLGLSSSWNADNTQLTVNLRQGVKWSDGKPFSSADVAFTFNTILTEAKHAADVQGDWVYLKSVAATGPNTVVFTFKNADTPAALYILDETFIVPQHIWQNVTAPATANPPLVGTGPFVQTTATPSLLVYQRNKNYWNNSANKIDELDFPAVKSNAALEEELIAGQLDWGSFGADASLKTAYVDKDPAHNKYYFSSTADVALYLNDSQPPFNNVDVRQAISAALDRSAMSTEAENGYEAPANPAGLTANNAPFLQAKYASFETTPDLNKVAQYMQAAGYTKGSDGMYRDKNGKELTVKYDVPFDWTDWVAIANIMKQNLHAAGIDGEVNAIGDSAFFAARATGSFSAMITGFFSGPTPFYQYNSHLNSKNDAATSGGENWGHYHNAQFDSLLQQYAQTSNTAQQTQLIYQMEDLFAAQMPVIPLLDAANWFEYSTLHYTGWPDAQHPYALGPTYDAPGNEIVVTHLVPTGN
ncbi:MAG TPA: ABC transporter substrate-binding protein [Ktedonobacteraceae bacterium]|nr:ABC transporter substrate-binding protein [Ktedonobacteraceae bacterium]